MNKRAIFAFATLAQLFLATRVGRADALCILLGLIGGALVASRLRALSPNFRWLPFCIALLLFPLACWLIRHPGPGFLGALLAASALGTGAGTRVAFQSTRRTPIRTSDIFVVLGLVGALFGGMILHGHILPLALVPFAIAAAIKTRNREWFG